MSIDIIRICGAALIFLCHACNESGSPIGSMLGQLFSIGVPMFFILSGYLHGQKTAPQNKIKWYGTKLKRLLLPLYIFLAVLAASYLAAGLPIDLFLWWQSIIPICGLTQKYIPGCGQLWFLTHILICYLLTPAMQAHVRLKRNGILLMAVIWLAACLLLAHTVSPIWCTLLNSLLNYAVGFYALPYLLRRKRSYALILGTAVFACGARVVCHLFWDETPFYNSVATGICSLILALSIMVFLFQIGKKLEETATGTARTCIAALSKRTYEFYLAHYIFLTGPLKIKLPHYLQSVLAAFALSIALAQFVHWLSNLFRRKLAK